jgi:hypothetical protein
VPAGRTACIAADLAAYLGPDRIQLGVVFARSTASPARAWKSPRRKKATAVEMMAMAVRKRRETMTDSKFGS